MLNRSFFDALKFALAQRRIAWLMARANLIEARRVNKIALITPFLSILLQVAFLGLIYATLFGADLRQYIPYLAISLAVWHTFTVFVMNAVNYNDIANRHLSFTALSLYTIHLAGLIETVLLLAAKLLAAFVVIILVQQSVPALSDIAFAALGAFILAVFLFFLGVIVAYVFDSFRILRALLPQLLLLFFLLTPVIWQETQLGDMAWIAHYNPLSHVLDVVRTPLTSGGFPKLSAGVVIAMSLLLALTGIAVHRANRGLVLFRWVA